MSGRVSTRPPSRIWTSDWKRRSRGQSLQRGLSASWNNSWTTWKKICSMRDPNSETSWQNWTRSWQRSLARHKNQPNLFHEFWGKTTMLLLHLAKFKSDILVSHLYYTLCIISDQHPTLAIINICTNSNLLN